MGSQASREIGLVLVSHSTALASGLADLAGQMAPDVLIRPAGGTSDGRLGTGYDVVEAAVEEVLGAGCSGVVILADLGSARMTAESVLDMADDPRLVLAAGAFVEGAVAAAVAAQTGADAATVARTIADTTRQLAAELADGDEAGSAETPAPAGAPPASLNGAVSTSVTVLNPQGLHARPAALLARRVAEFDATVTLDGVDASSLLSLMGLGLQQGASVTLEARGPQAGPAAEAVLAAFADGFGELP